MEDIQLLDNYKTRIEEEKTSLAQLRAEKKILEKSLKEEFDLDNLVDIEKRLTRVKRQVEALKKEFTQKKEELLQEFPL